MEDWLRKLIGRDFPGGSEIKTLPSNAEGAGLIAIGIRSHMPHSQKKKSVNTKQRQYCNKFNKDFKISNLNTTTRNNLAVLGTYQHHLSDLGIHLIF